MELEKTVTPLHRVFTELPSGDFRRNAHPLHRRPEPLHRGESGRIWTDSPRARTREERTAAVVARHTSTIGDGAGRDRAGTNNCMDAVGELAAAIQERSTRRSANTAVDKETYALNCNYATHDRAAGSATVRRVCE